jgi:hypothetical protein
VTLWSQRAYGHRSGAFAKRVLRKYSPGTGLHGFGAEFCGGSRPFLAKAPSSQKRQEIQRIPDESLKSR